MAIRLTLKADCARPETNSYVRRQGFNIDGGSYHAVRLGILGNQENDCQTPDSMIGIGSSSGLVVGSTSNLTYACTGAMSGVTVARTGFAWVWVR